MVNNTVVISSLLFFLFNPLVGMFIIIKNIISDKISERYKKKYLILFIIFVSIYFGLINSTKLIESDLAVYKQWFDDAQRYNIVEYLLIAGKEYAFYFITYILSSLLFGGFKLYVIVITFIIYCNIMYSYYLLSDYRSANSKEILIILMLFLFFVPAHFLWSMHLIRQIMAMSFFLLFLSYKVVKKKIIGFTFLYLFLLIHL